MIWLQKNQYYPVLVLIGICVMWCQIAHAQTAREKHLPLDGSIARNGGAVELRWPDATPPRVGAVVINRRQLGQSGGTTWQALGPALGPVMRFTDPTVVPGVPYEYQVMRTARDIVDVGYWATGVEIPAVETRGTAYLIVDETVAGPLSARLRRFMRDLTGDGWHVLRQDVPRGTPKEPLRNFQNALGIRSWLQDRYFEDPFARHTVILVGHVPVPVSGRVAPDGHGAQPHATDLFYAEMTGQWRVSPGGVLLENRVPGNAIEMQVGRVDFSSLSGQEQARELALLRRYFDKNHHWRMGMTGDLRRAYGQNDHLIGEQYGLRNIVGPDAVEQGGHHDTGVRRSWLWGVDFGSSDIASYLDGNDTRAVFAINFGSHKQKIERADNTMTALLAQPWSPLAVGWGGRPAWWLHHMALGGTIGDVHQRTVNNGVADQPYRGSMDYYPTGGYLWRNPIWINLLGDPTARAFVLAPPGALRAQPTAEGQRLSWEASADPDTQGYRIYRAKPGTSRFQPVDDGQLVRDLSFLDRNPVEDARYMVRAYGLKDVYAGSFYTLSQGSFSGPATDTAPVLPDVSLRQDQPTALPPIFNAPQDGVVVAIIEEPQTGRLAQDDTGRWIYTPQAGFTGTVPLRISVSDGWHTGVATFNIEVTP